MALTDIPIFSMLRTRLDWAQARQRVLAENVANADTPKFRPSDLAPLKFDSASRGLQPVRLATTESGHIPGLGGTDSEFRTQQQGRFNVRASGNGVNLEDQMMKVAANQMDYQAVSALYARSLNLLKTAIGKA
ncbi:MAG TPA: flagellar basal body rod protein FlgB [Pseudolabrys sp.]|jgi:flagellar basal-body rod protein FlgB|nr:flagellar basal body rod protein FlgB [Pseudolabrys sp.]